MQLSIFSFEGKSSCFFGNANDKEDETIMFQNNTYTIPAWSVSILPDCHTEAYNTAKVNTQTSIMVKKDNDAADVDYDDQEPAYRSLKWEWRKEKPAYVKKDGLVQGSLLTAQRLLDQKVVTNDTSDYLWYITR